MISKLRIFKNDNTSYYYIIYSLDNCSFSSINILHQVVNLTEEDFVNVMSEKFNSKITFYENTLFFDKEEDAKNALEWMEQQMLMDKLVKG